MPIVVCRVCGRVVSMMAPLDTLPAEERRCPRCGSTFEVGRSEDAERQAARRRQNRRRDDDRAASNSA